MINFLKKKIRFFALATLIPLASVAIVLGGISTIGSANPANVAVLLSSLNNPYFQAVSDGINAQAEKLGVPVQYYDSNNSIETEAMNVDNIIATGKKVVLFNDVNESSGVASVLKFTRAGVKVIAVDHILPFQELKEKKNSSGNLVYNITPENFQVVANIASDNHQAGKMLALYMHNIIKMPTTSARTFTLYGIPGTESGMSRAAGFQQPINSSNEKYTLSAYDGADAAVTANNVGFQVDDNRDKAFTTTTNQMINFPKGTATNNAVFKNVIFGTNDEAALGAIKALEQANNQSLLAGNSEWLSSTSTQQNSNHKIWVLGIDNTVDGINAIKQKLMSATVKQDTNLMGGLGVDIAKFLLDRNDPDSYYKTTYDYWYKKYPSAFTEDQKETTKMVDPGYYFKLHTSLTYLNSMNQLVSSSQKGETNELTVPVRLDDQGNPLATASAQQNLATQWLGKNYQSVANLSNFKERNF